MVPSALLQRPLHRRGRGRPSGRLSAGRAAGRGRATRGGEGAVRQDVGGAPPSSAHRPKEKHFLSWADGGKEGRTTPGPVWDEIE